MTSETAPAPASRPRVFYGYWIVAAAMLVQMLINGAGMYAFSLFVTPLEEAFGWTRAGIMLAFVVYNLGLAATSPLVGRLVDRHPARLVIAAGATLMGLGLAGLGLTTALWQYCLLWGLVGAGVSATGFVPMTAVLFRWFRRRRGLAVGLMGAGIGAGGFVMAPLVGGRLIPALGWRHSFLVLGAIVPAVIVPLALWLIKSRPSDVGQAVDGLLETSPATPADSGATASPAPLPAEPVGVSLAEAVRTATFWLMAVCFAAFGFAMNSIFQNQVPHLQDIGFPLATAASALSAVGIGSAAGKFVFGWICDLIKPRYVFVAGVLFQLASVVVLMSVRADSPLGLVWAYALLYGIGIGCWPVMSMVVSSTFGLAYYGSIFGVLNMVWTTGGSIGTPLAGYIRDTTGSYQLAFVMFLAAFLVTIPSVLLTRPVVGGKSS